jgi:5-hydroxyisourate hydrolase
MGKLSTHVLDNARGGAAYGMQFHFYRMDGDQPVMLMSGRTNADGRSDAPLLAADQVKRGKYRLTFAVADYYRAQGVTLPDPPFVDVAVLDFGIAEDGGSYHVPLLCTPWAYSTYRGS